MSQHNSYSFYNLIPHNPFFHSSIDATYIITMGHFHRILNIRHQSSFSSFTNNTYILLNHGFTRGDKQLIENKSNYDLIHCSSFL